MNTPLVLEELARQALEGDRDALDSLVRALQGDIYGLALQMLWNREDAEDVTQDILVRVVTRLSQFRFRSRLKTWVYRLAFNYFLDVKIQPRSSGHASDADGMVIQPRRRCPQRFRGYMSSIPESPEAHNDFIARYPKLGQAWELIATAGQQGSLDEKTGGGHSRLIPGDALDSGRSTQ